jgi:hypothetical protein
MLNDNRSYNKNIKIKTIVDDILLIIERKKQDKIKIKTELSSIKKDILDKIKKLSKSDV